MNFEKQRREFVESYEGFYINGYGNIVCPCGTSIEDDGECPEGHVSPLRQAGLI